jgi:hypothetical protein
MADKLNRQRIGKCDECLNFFIKARINSKQKQRFCSTKCRLALHNRERIQAGSNREYKAKKRKDGAKASYYG